MIDSRWQRNSHPLPFPLPRLSHRDSGRAYQSDRNWPRPGLGVSNGRRPVGPRHFHIVMSRILSGPADIMRQQTI